jgi:hypothetical protein
MSDQHVEKAADVLVVSIEAFTEHVGLVMEHIGAIQQHSTSEQDGSFTEALATQLGQEFGQLLAVHQTVAASLAAVAMVRARLEGGMCVAHAIKQMPQAAELGVLRQHKAVLEATRKFNEQLGLFKMTRTGEVGFA